MKSKKILIIEDEKPTAKALCEKFLGLGHEVFLAEDGVRGLDKALELHPDIIILDLEMPAKGGIEMLGDLRKDDWGKNANVVVLTNYSDPSMVADVLAAGTTEYLVKTDWKLTDLLDHIVSKVSLDKD